MLSFYKYIYLGDLWNNFPVIISICSLTIHVISCKGRAICTLKKAWFDQIWNKSIFTWKQIIVKLKTITLEGTFVSLIHLLNLTVSSFTKFSSDAWSVALIFTEYIWTKVLWPLFITSDNATWKYPLSKSYSCQILYLAQSLDILTWVSIRACAPLTSWAWSINH